MSDEYFLSSSKIRRSSLRAMVVIATLLSSVTTVDANPIVAPPQAFHFRSIRLLQQPDSPYSKPEPAYAKWGKLAVEETKKRYPQAQVVDYLHVGRQNKSPELAQETFKLWLHSGPREFGVFVTIVFDKQTEKIRSIGFCETNH